jgi:predicted ester cyclase
MIRWSGRGTHTSAFRGLPPTGRQITHRGVHIFRFDGDQIVEMWPMVDRLGALQQLGILPELPAPQPTGR